MRIPTFAIILVLFVAASLPAEEIRAVYYASSFQGRHTANGDVFDHEGLTAAHPTLPFGTLVRLTNLANMKTVVVKINDRLARRSGELIDVTAKAARELDFFRAGTARVSMEVVK